ncbi:MAG: DUF6398 domain-containing protein [Candidatus Methylumidiphilus sp.]
MKKGKSENVPKEMHGVYKAIVDLTDAFASQQLNEEYAQMIRLATATLCRKRPSPLVSGKPNTWACGIIHALGTVNFLFDKSQNPHIGAADLANAFNIAASTAQGKSKLVRDILRMSPFEPEWTLPSRMEKNPRAWLIMVNGMIVDARCMSREVQEVAYKKGLIPYIPDET